MRMRGHEEDTDENHPSSASNTDIGWMILPCDNVSNMYFNKQLKLEKFET